MKESMTQLKEIDKKSKVYQQGLKNCYAHHEESSFMEIKKEILDLEANYGVTIMRYNKLAQSIGVKSIE